MSDFDPEEPPAKVELPTQSATFTIVGWDPRDVQEAIATHVGQLILSKIQKKIDGMIGAAVDRAITDQIDAAIRERISHDVVAMLNDGFTVTNEYGHPQGKITVRGRIEQAFKPNPYTGKTGIPGIIDSAIAKHFNAEMEAATKRVREHVDALLRTTIDAAVIDRIRAALGSAFGLKVPS